MPSGVKTGADQMLFNTYRRNFQDIYPALHVYFRVKPGQRHIHLAYHGDEIAVVPADFNSKLITIQSNYLSLS